jgi:DNA-binding response OmpR family regulator
VVDDTESVRTRLVSLIVEELSNPEVDVRGASDLTTALACLENAPIRAVLLDFHLLGECGLDVIERVRASAGDALVVVLTNEVTDYHRRECIEHGADCLLDKSHDFERAVALVVERVLAAHKS